jgi:hypothetical protein
MGASGGSGDPTIVLTVIRGTQRTACSNVRDPTHDPGVGIQLAEVYGQVDVHRIIKQIDHAAFSFQCACGGLSDLARSNQQHGRRRHVARAVDRSLTAPR